MPAPTRVALLTNIPAPYRIPFFQNLSKKCNLLVVFDSRLEGNRQWNVPDDLGFPHNYVSGITIPYTRRRPDGIPEDTRYLQLRYGVLTELMRFKPDVVVSAEYGARSLLGALYCAVAGKPLVLWSQGTPHSEGWVRKSKLLVRRFLISRSLRYWVYGREAAELVRGYGARADRIDMGMTSNDTRKIWESVKQYLTDREAVRQKYALHGVSFLFVGQFIPRKGVKEFLSALEHVAQRRNDFSVLFVGDGPQRKLIEAWAARHKGINVRIEGFKPHLELSAIYTAADIFVMPTLDDNWSQVALEAAVSGLSQAFSKYNGAGADLLPMGAFGIISDPLDIEEFGNVLMAFGERCPDRLSEKITNALVQYYSPEQFAERAWRSIQNAVGV